MTADLTLTSGGMEMSLSYRDDINMDEYATFLLLDQTKGREVLREWYRPYLQLAREHGAAFQFDTLTWRANRNWGIKLGYDEEALDRINREAVTFVRDFAAAEVPDVPIRVCGIVGTGDTGDKPFSADEAAEYAVRQIATLVDAGVDAINASGGCLDETIGVARAAIKAGVPVIVNLTPETDGCLADGTELGAAITLIDAATEGAVESYAISCAHTSHFDGALAAGDDKWRSRISSMYSNGTPMSHEELYAADVFPDGDPAEFGKGVVAIRESLPSLRTVGGCCGTLFPHVAAAAAEWRAADATAL